MENLTEKLKKVTVKPKKKECQYCGKIVSKYNISKHQKTKACKIAKVGWQIRESQAIIAMHKLRIVNLRQQQALLKSNSI